jgi:uncharacterized protein (TIGR02466 family)
MPTNQLFSTPIHVHDLEPQEFEQVQSSIAQVIDQVQARPSPWTDQVKTSFDFQGVNDIRNLDLTKLAQSIFTALAQYHEDIACPGSEFNLLESWFNFYDQGDFMFAHTHPGHKVSGVYYYKAQGTEGNICFENPNALGSTMEWPYCYQRQLQQHFVEPQAGRLVLFPSWLRHRVIPNTTDQQRISISFNLG